MRVLSALDDDAISLEVPRSAAEAAFAGSLKDALRESGGDGRLLRALLACLGGIARRRATSAP